MLYPYYRNVLVYFISIRRFVRPDIRVAPYYMTATKRMHEPHLCFLLIVIAVNVFSLELNEVLLHLVFVIANIHKAIIVLMAFLFMKHHLLFLFLIKCIILVSFLGLKRLLSLNWLATQYDSIDGSNSLNLIVLRWRWIFIRISALNSKNWGNLKLLVEKRKPNLLRNVFDLFFKILTTLARIIFFALVLFPLFRNIFVFNIIGSRTLHFECLLVE